MNIFSISCNNLRAKPLSTLLSLILFATGISIISLMLLASYQVEEKFKKNVANIDLVVGAKGSPLQLILCNVFHIDYPTGNILREEAKMVENHPFVDKTIPLALGDNYKGYRIVGTNHDYLDIYNAVIQEGVLWDKDFEVTIGAVVADRTGLGIGDNFTGVHGFIGNVGHHHDEFLYIVKSILKPSGTVADQIIFTNVASVWKVHSTHDHEQHAEDDHDHSGHDAHHGQDSNYVQGEIHDHDKEHEHTGQLVAGDDDPTKEITSLLVFIKNPMGAVQLPRLINENTNMQAAVPSFEINRLVSLLGVGIDTITALAYFIMIISGLSIFISLLNSLKERKYELALMRVLGSDRTKLFVIIIVEGLIIAVAGYILGIFISHAGMQLAGLYFEDSVHYSFSGLLFVKEELYLFIGTIIVGFFAAIIPAVKGCMTNISGTLAEA